MTENYLKMAEMYKRFTKTCKGLDFSDKAKEDFYNYETFGEGDIRVKNIFNPTTNGYAIGKKWMDVTIAMWKKDLVSYKNPEGLLYFFELEKDYPKWFLMKMLPERYIETKQGRERYENWKAGLAIA